MIEAMLASGAVSKPPLFVYTTNEAPYLHIFDTADGTKLTGTPQPGPNSAIAFSPDNSQCAVTYTGTNITYLQIYNVDTWEAVGDRVTLVAATQITNQIEYSPDGTLLAIALAGSARVLKTSDLSEVVTGIPVAGSKSVAWNPTGTILAIGLTGTPYLRVYNVSNWTEITLPAASTGVTGNALFSGDGQYLFHANGRFVRAIRTSDWTLAASLTLPSSGTVASSIAVNKDGDQVLLGMIGSANTEGPLWAYRFDGSAFIKVFMELLYAQTSQNTKAVFSPRFNYFALIYTDYNVASINRALVWGVDNGPAPFPIISDRAQVVKQNCFFSN